MNKKQDTINLYKNPAIRPPTLKDLSSLCKTFGIRRSDEYLNEMKENITEYLQAYERVDSMVAPSLPVKYPRTPGFKPEPEENIYNAWYIPISQVFKRHVFTKVLECDIAGASDGLLKGKRVAIKDSLCVAGVPMMVGTRLLENFISDIDATVVTRILDAGGRVTGKTNCEEYLTGVSSWSNATGPTLNPHNTRHSAGGSSGGSAVVVQVGDADMAIGGDQGGSGRIPASWCGIVGLKPTWGLVPCTGATGFDMTIDHVCPMTRTVTDCALLLECIAGYEEENDPPQPKDLTVPKYRKLLNDDIAGMKIGLVTEGFAHCKDDVQKIVRDAANRLTKNGLIVEECSVPGHNDGHSISTVICNVGIHQTIVKGCGVFHNYNGFYPTAIMDQLRTGFLTKANSMSDNMVFNALSGEYIYQNHGTKFYAKAQNLKRKLARAYNTALETYDALVMPTTPYTAPPLPTAESTVTERKFGHLQLSYGRKLYMYHRHSGKDRLKNSFGPDGILFKNTGPFDVTGHPALSVNAGTSDGLPVGMMIIGRHFDEVNVLRIARAVEKLGEEYII